MSCARCCMAGVPAVCCWKSALMREAHIIYLFLTWRDFIGLFQHHHREPNCPLQLGNRSNPVMGNTPLHVAIYLASLSVLFPRNLRRGSLLRVLDSTRGDRPATQCSGVNVVNSGTSRDSKGTCCCCCCCWYQFVPMSNHCVTSNVIIMSKHRVTSGIFIVTVPTTNSIVFDPGGIKISDDFRKNQGFRCARRFSRNLLSDDWTQWNKRVTWLI